MRLDFRKKIWLEGHNPIIFLQEKVLGIVRFAYVEMTVQAYERLISNPACYKGAKYHGKVILSGSGLPSEEQKCFMEKHYGFDHATL